VLSLLLFCDELIGPVIQCQSCVIPDVSESDEDQGKAGRKLALALNWRVSVSIGKECVHMYIRTHNFVFNKHLKYSAHYSHLRDCSPRTMLYMSAIQK
jgi:hypothetical protein